MKRLERCGVPEFQRIAASLRAELPAVWAAFTLPEALPTLVPRARRYCVRPLWATLEAPPELHSASPGVLSGMFMSVTQNAEDP
jgi:hypothetical protein